MAIVPNAAMAAGHSIQCETSSVSVIATDSADASDACQGATASLSFFAARGLLPAEPIVIEVVPDLPESAGPTAAGCYLKDENRVLIVPYASFRENKTWFNLPIDRALYRSLAAHEVAHAVAGCHFALPNPALHATEYVAYVATFATMGAALRTRVLDAIPGEGFDSVDRITRIFYMFEPMRFGAEAYRHYMKPENGDDFLHAVLAGKALAK